MMNNHKSLKPGDLLISRPLLEDELFSNSVILLATVDNNSTFMGFMLNVATSMTLNCVFPTINTTQNIPIYQGGPCDTDKLFILHTLGDRFNDSHEIIPGLYIGAAINDVIEYIELGGKIEGNLRFFIGYSGWDEEQLKNELADNSWAVTHIIKNEDLFIGDSLDYWKEHILKLDGKYNHWKLLPTEVELN